MSLDRQLDCNDLVDSLRLDDALPTLYIADFLKVHDYSSVGQGRGIRALCDIPAGTRLCSIPNSTGFSIYASRLYGRYRDILNAFGGNAWLQLIVCLMYENSQILAGVERQSRYMDLHLQLFPKAEEFTTPMWYDASELAELQGCSLLNRLGNEEAESVYETEIVPFLQAHAAWFDASVCTLRDFHRWGSCILGNAFDLEDQDAPMEEQKDAFSADDLQDLTPTCKVFVPFADLFNADSHKHNVAVRDRTGTLTLKTSRDVKAGDQLFVPTGQLPSSEMLRRYGFVESEENREDTAEVSGALIAEWAVQPNKLTRAQLKRRLDFLLEWCDDSFEISHAGVVPQEMRMFVEMLMLSDEDYSAFERDALVSTGKKTSALQTAILEILQARLRQFKTTRAKDEALLAAGALSFNMQNILRVRLSEKRIIEKAMAKVPEWAREASSEDEEMDQDTSM